MGVSGGPGGGGGTWRYVRTTGIWTDPMRTVRSKNARVVKKVGEKETPLGENETPLGEKARKLAKK